jgi:glutathione peroxidase-family protein
MESTNEIISTQNHIFVIASLTKQKGLNALTCPTIEFLNREFKTNGILHAHIQNNYHHQFNSEKQIHGNS